MESLQGRKHFKTSNKRVAAQSETKPPLPYITAENLLWNQKIQNENIYAQDPKTNSANQTTTLENIYAQKTLVLLRELGFFLPIYPTCNSPVETF